MGLIITLIVIGLVLVFAEVLLIPGVGVAGILGLASMAGSCVYAFMEMGNGVGIVITAVNVVLIVALTIWVLRARTWERLALHTNIDSKAVVPEISVAVGDHGKAMTRLAPIGAARFGNNILEVTALEDIIDAGQDIKVVSIDGIKVYVIPSEVPPVVLNEVPPVIPSEVEESI